MTLLICAAAALTLLLGAFVLSPMGDVKEAAAPEADTPPGLPFGVYGYTYAADGVTKLGYCAVTITNVDTGYSWATTSGSTGFYSLGIYGTAGDLIRVEAVNGDLYGVTEAEATGVTLNLNVTLNQVIPEFPMVLVPVVGMIGLLAVAGIRRRRSVEP